VVAEDAAGALAAIQRAWVPAAMVASVAGMLGYFDVAGLSAVFTKFGRAAGTFKDPNVLGPFLTMPTVYLMHGFLVGTHRRPALAWLRRSDYLGDPAVPLDQAVRDKVEQETGRRPEGPIRLLTHLRYFGLAFNPVSFYYCFDATGQQLETIVAEITNTPWKERHAYVLADTTSDSSRELRRYRFGKSFHVSPFMEMDMDYDWCFGVPGQSLGVHMVNLKQGRKVFDATLVLERQEIGTLSLARVLTIFPFMTLKVVGAIYWQALRLWLKRMPFYTHPVKQSSAVVRDIAEGTNP